MASAPAACGDLGHVADGGDVGRELDEKRFGSGAARAADQVFERSGIRRQTPFRQTIPSGNSNSQTVTLSGCQTLTGVTSATPAPRRRLR